MTEGPENYQEAVELCLSFCEKNGIRPPKFKINPRLKSLYGRYDYRRSTVETNPAVTESSRAYRRCSNPYFAHLRHIKAFFTDFTAFGTVVHEFGHHVDGKLRRFVGARQWYDLSSEWIMGPMSVEAPVSKYEISTRGEATTLQPDCTAVLESIAEGLRLFVSNPGLLRECRPERYRFFRKGFGLRPMGRRKWYEASEELSEFKDFFQVSVDYMAV